MSIERQRSDAWARARPGPTGPYLTVGNEFGVSATIVRSICGNVGTNVGDNVDDAERVEVLRRKMEMANFTPLRERVPEQEEAVDELRELRTCILCTNLLDDDDPGEEVVNSEDCTEHAVTCRGCRREHSRI